LLRPAAERVKIGAAMPTADKLIRAEQLIREERRMIDTQRNLIAALTAHGSGTDAAEGLLQQMLATLAHMEATRDRIRGAIPANQNTG